MPGKPKPPNNMKALFFTVGLMFVGILGFSQRTESGSSKTLNDVEKVNLMQAVLADPLWQSYSAVHQQQVKAVDFSLRFLRKDGSKLSTKRPLCGKNIETTLMQAGIPNATEIIRLQTSLADLSKQLNERYPQLSNLKIDDWLRYYQKCK
jgi:hypothetical protein